MAFLNINTKGLTKSAIAYSKYKESRQMIQRLTTIPILIVFTIIVFVGLVWGSDWFTEDNQTQEEKENTRFWTKMGFGLALLMLLAFLFASIMSLYYYTKGFSKLF